MLAESQFNESTNVFYLACKVYNRWKINNANQTFTCSLEFGVDDYIRTKASYAESLMNTGDIKQAIEKFNNVKNSIESEIVYENPLLYVNVCNMLGNCYLAVGMVQKALENFELSLSMINNMDSKISDLVVGKICLNIAIIRS